MTEQRMTPAATSEIPCPACGGPARHPGVCVDGDGYVLPDYAALAEMWEEQGRPVLTDEELADLGATLSADDEDERRG